MPRARAAAARASLSDSGAPADRTLARRAAITAAVVLVPGGFALGGALLARAYLKRRARDRADAGEAIAGEATADRAER